MKRTSSSFSLPRLLSRSESQRPVISAGRTAASALSGAIALLITAVASQAAPILDVDTFNTNQSALTLTFPPAGTTASSSVSGAGILGGERDIVLSLNSGVIAGNTESAVVSSGFLSYSQDATIGGSVTLQWDGVDGSSALNPTGLGGLDLTGGGLQNKFLSSVFFDDLPVSFTLTVYTDAGNASQYTTTLPGLIFSATPLEINYSAFSTFLGTGASFANVGAITLTLGSGVTAPDLVLDYLSIAPPLVPQSWDTNGATTGLGGTGNWNLTTANWNDATGTATPATWVNGNSAIFGGTAGTVTVTDPGIIVKDLTFNTTGYIIDGAQSLTLSPNSTFTVTSANDIATIKVALIGNDTLTKAGAGNLELMGANTYTGGTAVNDGTLTVTGVGASITHTSNDLTVGDATLKVLNGGKVNVRAVGLNGSGATGAQAFVDGTKSNITTTGSFFIGTSGKGALDIRHGGSTQSVNIFAGNAKVTVNGVGSSLTTANSVFLGTTGTTSTLNVEAGATATIGANLFAGDVANSTGNVTVTGPGSKLTTTSSAFIGNFGTGTLNVLNGAEAETGSGFIGSQGGSTGTATVSGTDSKWTVNGLLAVGSNGTGTLNVLDHAVVSNTGNMQVGINGSSVGTVVVDGGAKIQNAGQLAIGQGSVTVSGGSSITGTSGFVGVNGKVGTLKVTGANSTATFSNLLAVGNGGSGTLQVLAGGKVTSVGNSSVNTGSSVVVDGVGSSWVNDGDVAFNGGSSVTISGGGVVQNTRAFVSNGGNTVLVTGAGSQWINTGEVGLAQFSDATLTVADGGVVRVDAGGVQGAGTMYLGDKDTATGTLNIGAAPFSDAAAAGSIDAAFVSSNFYGSGQAVVNFNHTDTGYVFAPVLANNLSVGQYAGVTIFNKANTYTGGTYINGGTLRTENANALGSGLVTLNDGKLAASGALNVSALTWTGGNIQLNLGAGDVVHVTGAFNNGGAGGGGAYVFDTAGLTQTTYLLTTFASSTGFSLGDFTALALNPNITLQGQFVFTPASSVQFTVTGATATGPTLQNSAPVGVPTFADFIVNGPVTTGAPGESNTVKTLTFQPGSSLEVFNKLTVSQGPVNLVDNSSVHLNNSTLSASQLSLLGGTLHGNGIIAGNLYNGGLVSPGNSPGKIVVTGNYTQASNGTLHIDVGGRKAGQFDQLVVNGSAQLDGTLQLVRLNGFKVKRGDKIEFLTAAGGVSGEFADIENPFDSRMILEPTVVYRDHSVALEVERGSFADYARAQDLTPNQFAVAKNLDRVATEKPNDKVLTYLDRRELSKLPGDFDRLAPEELTSMFTISTALANVQGLNLQRRTDDIRSGANGFSAAGLAINGQTPSYSGNFLTGAAGPTGNGKEIKETKQVIAEENKWGVFLSGTGEWVDVDGNGNARGFDITTGGFTLGLDYKITSNFAIGLAAGYAGTSADLTDNGRVWVNGGKLGLYATYFTGGFYADAAVTGGYNSYDTKRSALQGAARGSTDGGELNVLLGTGYDFKIGALTVGPTATFQYTLVSVDGYTEYGSLAPLDIAGRDAESVRSAFGFKASYDWKLGGIVIRPELRAAWQHEYGDRSYDLSASFANGTGGDFLVNGPELGRDSLLLGAGVAVQFSERATAYLYYDGELARENYQSHSVSGGIRLAF